MPGPCLTRDFEACGTLAYRMHKTGRKIGRNFGNPYPSAESRHGSKTKVSCSARKVSPPPVQVAGFSFGIGLQAPQDALFRAFRPSFGG